MPIIIDGRGNQNSGEVKTICFRTDHTPYWSTIIDDKDRHIFCDIEYGKLERPLSDYSDYIIKKFRETGNKCHQQVLEKIEDIYKKDRVLTKNFLRGMLLPQKLY